MGKIRNGREWEERDGMMINGRNEGAECSYTFLNICEAFIVLKNKFFKISKNKY